MSLHNERLDKLKELEAWARGKSLNGIESRLYDEAMRRFHCTEQTARSYAKSVRMMLEGAQTTIATV